ncbi:hypothetical protein RRG08_042884 [Elysia crispata]|uniref:Uncharacterized protein n=1 Tax=Elysia crispata TaxID=231223 RepID=A0AAE1AQJ4_9GAST|nr:hypothetical protein RRG08_042884 [Elysia crispata]
MVYLINVGFGLVDCMVYLINVGFGLVDCMVYAINIGIGLVDCMVYLTNVWFGLVALSVIPAQCTVWVGCLVDYTPVDQNQTNRRRIASGLFLFATKNKENCVMGKDNEKYNLPVQYLLFNYAGGLHIKLWPDPRRISWLITSENLTTIHYANLTTIHYANFTTVHYANLTTIYHTNLITIHYTNLTTIHYANPTTIHYTNLTTIYHTNLTTIHYTNLNTIHYTNPTTIHYTNPTTTHYTNPTTTNLIARAWMGGISMSQRKCCFHSLRRFMWKMRFMDLASGKHGLNTPRSYRLQGTILRATCICFRALIPSSNLYLVLGHWYGQESYQYTLPVLGTKCSSSNLYLLVETHTK